MKTLKSLQEEILKEFDEKYFDISTPSGINTKNFQRSFDVIKDAKSFLLQATERVAREALLATTQSKDVAYKQVGNGDNLDGWNAALTESERLREEFLK